MANKKKSKGYGNLWIIAIGLIGAFVLATVIAPQLTGHGQTNSNNGWNTDMPSGQAVFSAPNTTLSGSGLQINEVADFSAYASPVEDTTGSGGVFAWIFQIDGAGGNLGVANVGYDGGASSVEWSNASSGAIVGVGPRFVQGPGAVSMGVSSALSISMTAAGTYTLKIWIASTHTNTSDIRPSNYTSVSPMVMITLNVVKPTNSSVSVDQEMSVPSSDIARGQWTSFIVTTTATGTGRWSEPITIHIAIEKKSIKLSDLSLRVNTGSSYTSPGRTDEGDRLVASIATVTPLTGRSDPETGTATTVLQINFTTSGSYELTSWAESSSGSQLSQVTSDTLTVGSTAVIPTPEPIDTNDTNTTEPSQNNTTPVTPAVNTSIVENIAATVATRYGD
ncbi:MAG: hypothetical protein SA339_06180 [Methanomassiliicoccus sp.]|nr:hypothetical protein [Methanomassiliicoccus sp.]